MKSGSVAVAVLMVGVASFCHGELAMFEPFDRTAVKSANPPEGLYVEATPLMAGFNPETAGGRMVGFSTDEPWKGQTQLPRVMPDPHSDAQGGHLVFRGSADADDRAVWRTFKPATTAAVEYLGLALTPVQIDPDGTVLVAFAQRGRDSAAVAKAFLDGADFEHGFALGFQGNGNGGMNLVLRYRDIDVQPAEEVLVENVQVAKTYEVVMRVDWDTIPRGTSPREEVTIWVNPGDEGENAGAILRVVATSGQSGLLNTIYLLLRGAGSDAVDVAIADNLWVGTAFADRPADEVGAP